MEKKVIIKNLLSFLILLLSGYSQVFASANHDCTHITSIKNIIIAEHTRGHLTDNGDILKIKSILSAADVKHSKIVSMEDLDEIDDDKLLSFKKQANVAKCIEFPVFNISHRYSLKSETTPTFICKDFFYSSCRYIIFRVLRI